MPTYTVLNSGQTPIILFGSGISDAPGAGGQCISAFSPVDDAFYVVVGTFNDPVALGFIVMYLCKISRTTNTVQWSVRIQDGSNIANQHVSIAVAADGTICAFVGFTDSVSGVHYMVAQRYRPSDGNVVATSAQISGKWGANTGYSLTIKTLSGVEYIAGVASTLNVTGVANASAVVVRSSDMSILVNAVLPAPTANNGNFYAALDDVGFLWVAYDEPTNKIAKVNVTTAAVTLTTLPSNTKINGLIFDPYDHTLMAWDSTNLYGDGTVYKYSLAPITLVNNLVLAGGSGGNRSYPGSLLLDGAHVLGATDNLVFTEDFATIPPTEFRGILISYALINGFTYQGNLFCIDDGTHNPHKTGGVLFTIWSDRFSSGPQPQWFDIGLLLPPSNIIVTKTTIPFADGVDYTFRPSWGAPFSLIDGGSQDSGPLAPGVYSITEDPTAGTLTTIDVSNGDPPNAINLGAGETVTVAFTNSATAPAPPGGTSFVKKKAPTPGTIQVVPLDNSPNQVWGVTVKVDDQSIPLRITLRYNELAKYWIATIKDKKGNVLLDSLPFITGTGISQNLLGQFVHLALGSATVFNASSLASDRPNNQNLGKDFLLIWGDTPAEESDVVTRLVVPVTFPPGGETPPPPPPPPPPGPPSPVPGDVDVLDYCINSQAATMHLTGFALNGNPANSYSFIDPPTHSFAFIKSNAGWADDILLYYADRIDQFITEMDDADHRLWSDNRAYKRLRKSLPVMPRFITPGAIPTVFDLPKPNQYDRLINCLVIDTKDKGDVTNFTYPPVIMNLDSWGAGGGNIGPVSVIVNERYSGKFARERFYLGLHLGLMYWDAANLTSGLKFTGTYTVSNWAAHNKLVAGGGVGSSFGCGYGVGWP